MSGQDEFRYSISNVSNDSLCTVTTTEENALETGDFVRLTDLNGMMPVKRGVDQINNYKFKIVVIDTTNFYLKDPITDEFINSTTFPTYITGGSCTKVQTEFQYES